MLNPQAKPYLPLPQATPSPPPTQIPSQPLVRPPFYLYFPYQHRPGPEDYLFCYAAPSPLIPSLNSITATKEVENNKSKIEALEVQMEVSEAKKEKDDGAKRMGVPTGFKRFNRDYFYGRSRGKKCVLVWRPKGMKTMENLSGDRSSPFINLRKISSPFNVNGFKSKVCGQTTVMVKNLPNKFSRKMMVDLLDQHCIQENDKSRLELDPCLSEYDFLYLPMDFTTRCNLGYAFVNFTSAVAVSRFHRSFQDYKWNLFDSKKICEISFAKIQGKDELVGQFRKSYFTCDTDEFLPIEFSPPRNGSTSCPPPSTVGSLVGRRRAPS